MLALRESPVATGLVFENRTPVVHSHPHRADVALFVGFVGRRGTPLSGAQCAWLDEQGWLLPAHGRLPIAALDDVPVPIESWQAFDRLFAWDERPLDERTRGAATYIGAAVRSFFAQGGRR